MEPDGEIKIYSSGADTCVCVGTVKLEELMKFCVIGERT